MSSPRVVYRQGQSTIRYLVVWLLGAALVIGGAMLFFLQKSIIGRLMRLSDDVKKITAVRDPARRVHVHGADELASLGGAVNQMLEGLEHSQDALRQSEERYRSLSSHLEWRVSQRTTQLRSMNRYLRAEINERRRAEEILKRQAAAMQASIDRSSAPQTERPCDEPQQNAAAPGE